MALFKSLMILCDGSWLYSLFLGLDANFRLKQKDVSSDKHDNSLSVGWSYFIPSEQYKAHLVEHKDEIELVCTIESLPSYTKYCLLEK